MELYPQTHLSNIHGKLWQLENDLKPNDGELDATKKTNLTHPNDLTCKTPTHNTH